MAMHRSALAANTFDLLLLDIRMPGKTGLDVLRAMKETAHRSRIIMLTAVDDLEVAIEAIRLGKRLSDEAFRFDTLMSCITRILDGKAHARRGSTFPIHPRGGPSCPGAPR